MDYKSLTVSDLVGLTFTNVIGLEHGADRVVFTTSSGKTITMAHEQECCEEVYLEDVDSPTDIILNSPILEFEQRLVDCYDTRDEKVLATFYVIKTMKGHMTMRWIGSSNGYYSVGVSIFEGEDY